MVVYEIVYTHSITFFQKSQALQRFPQSRKRIVDHICNFQYHIRAMKTQLLTALALSTGNILGPLALFGGLGWWLSERSGTNVYVIVGIFIAFVCSNVLILTTTSKMMKLVNKPK